MPTEGAVPSPSSAARTFPSPAGGRGAVRGRKGARCDFTAHGPTPGPPPPCGMQKVLCRLRCETSEPHLPGRATPTRAFMFAPSVYTCPPCLCTVSQISTPSSSHTPFVPVSLVRLSVVSVMSVSVRFVLFFLLFFFFLSSFFFFFFFLFFFFFFF